MKRFVLLIGIALAIVSPFAAAGTMTIVNLPATGTDAAIDISTAKTYTHTFDFGTASGSPVTINGVAFDQGPTANLTAPYTGTSRWGYGYTIGDTRASTDIWVHAGGSHTQADGQSNALLRDMMYHSWTTRGTGISVTLSGLNKGSVYSTRFYYRMWSGPSSSRAITVKGDGGHNGIFSDTMDLQLDGGGAHYLDYTFTADDSDVAVQFITNNDNGSGVHLYGLSNEIMSSSVAWKLNPANGQGLATSGSLSLPVLMDAVLSWSAADAPSLDPAYTVQYAVYVDPNQVKVITGTGCVYTQPMNTATSFNPTPDMAYETQYYWRVATQVKFLTEPNIYTLPGAVYTFKTNKQNTAPVVNAGKSIVTWLAMAQAGLNLNARISPATLFDNEADSLLTWSAISSMYPGLPAAAVTFSNTAVLNPVVTIGSTGTYTLKLQASDGFNPISESLMEIKVYADSCEAAKNNPNTTYVKNPYDYDDNCVVDMGDFVIFAAQWLEDTSATTNQEYTASGLLEKDLLLWLDASDSSSLTLDTNNKVTRWNDKSGNGYYLVAGATGSDPNYLAADKAVDFGPAVGDTTGKWMHFKNTDTTDLNLSSIRTVFWVIKGGNFLLGDDNLAHFHRGGDTLSPTSNIWTEFWTSANIQNGKTYLNGVNVNGTITALPAGYSLVSLVTTGNVEASRLCSDRTNRTGGQQIAEIIIFNRALSDSERQTIEAALKAKWGL